MFVPNTWTENHFLPLPYLQGSLSTPTNPHSQFLFRTRSKNKWHTTWIDFDIYLKYIPPLQQMFHGKPVHQLCMQKKTCTCACPQQQLQQPQWHIREPCVDSASWRWQVAAGGGFIMLLGHMAAAAKLINMGRAAVSPACSRGQTAPGHPHCSGLPHTPCQASIRQVYKQTQRQGFRWSGWWERAAGDAAQI